MRHGYRPCSPLRLERFVHPGVGSRTIAAALVLRAGRYSCYPCRQPGAPRLITLECRVREAEQTLFKVKASIDRTIDHRSEIAARARYLIRLRQRLLQDGHQDRSCGVPPSSSYTIGPRGLRKADRNPHIVGPFGKFRPVLERSANKIGRLRARRANKADRDRGEYARLDLVRPFGSTQGDRACRSEGFGFIFFFG